jgi:hypothetical protein
MSNLTANRGKIPASSLQPGLVQMNIEKITVRTESGQTIEVVVLSKRAGCIQVVVGEGTHSVRCELLPTRTGRAYSGTVMGRELVYERSPEQVQADIDRLNPDLRLSRRPRRHQ